MKSHTDVWCNQLLRTRLLGGILLGGLLACWCSVSSAFTLDLSDLMGAGEPGTDYIPKIVFTLDAPLAPAKAVVKLVPKLPAKIDGFSADAETAYNADDGAQFPDWTFTEGSESTLKGTLAVDTYQARRGTAMNEGTGNYAGALMQAHYTPHADDPDNLTWVQYFQDNTGTNGALVNHIDPFPNDDGNEKMPFYWRDNEGGEHLSDPFEDRPSDAITSNPFHRFVNFEVYLASYDPAEVNDGTDGGAITIYGGMSWGYDIRVVPEPTSAAYVLSLLVCCAAARPGRNCWVRRLPR